MTEISALCREIDLLASEVRREGNARADAWADSLLRPGFPESATNLAHYLALRRHDLRPLQRQLMLLGLSSLGRLESRVLPTLLAVRAALAALAGRPPGDSPPNEWFFAGEQRLAERTREVFGPASPNRPVHLLVTCPTAAADDPGFLRDLAARGVEAVRINCAHDDAGVWQRMIDNTRAAEQATGRRFKILMDLAGPKIRTGDVRVAEGKKKVHRGDLLAVVPPGGLARLEMSPPTPAAPAFAMECTLPEALQAAKPGHHLFLDDGKLAAVVEQTADWGLTARVTAAADKGVRLKPEKGLNFPDSDLRVAALTEKDLADLDFVAREADGIGYSFVQSPDDVALLQNALAERRPDDWWRLSLVLKIETPKAVKNLPDILVRAAGRQPTAVMIARGDLAVEIGFARLAEMQEEILWIGEAAHVPVIWATQVLESLIKKGRPSRGEMTDAAMAARAECVMLNKGPHLLDAIAELDTLLQRMEQHQHKKTPQLRRLQSW